MSTRLDRMQAGFVSVFNAEMPNARTQWAYGMPAFEQLTTDYVVNLRLVSGPTKKFQTHSRGKTFQPFDSITFTIANATSGAIYFVELNYFIYSYNATGADTVDTIRDQLVARINMDTNDPYTAAATANPGEFIVTPDSFASIHQGKKSSNIDITNKVDSAQAAILTRGSREAVVNIQVFKTKDKSTSTTPRLGAWPIMEKIQDITENRELIDVLWNEYGIRIIDFGTVVDISEIAGASWESRVSSDVTIHLDSFETRPTETVDSIGFVFQGN